MLYQLILIDDKELSFELNQPEKKMTKNERKNFQCHIVEEAKIFYFRCISYEKLRFVSKLNLK